MTKMLKKGLGYALLLFSSTTVIAEPVTLKACGHHDYPPWNWLQNNQIVGACASVTKNLFARVGVEVDLSYVGPWKRCQYLIEQGKVDINICSFMNDERKSYSQFISTPMGINENAVFVKKGQVFPFSNWQDLQGRHAGMVLGVSIGKEFDQFLKSEQTVTRLQNYTSAFNMLNKDRLDYVPFGRHSGQALLQSIGLADAITPLPHPLLTGQLYISMSKKSPHLHLLPQIEQMMQEESYPGWVEEQLQEHTKNYVQHYHAQREPVN